MDQDRQKSAKNELRRERGCVCLLHAHLVFVTKYPKNIFSSEWLKDMREIFEIVCRNFEASLKEFNGEGNHVHLLVEYPPKVSISKLVNSLKGVSSRLLKQKILIFTERERYGLPVILRVAAV